jgi:hypothetical protein
MLVHVKDLVVNRLVGTGRIAYLPPALALVLFGTLGWYLFFQSLPDKEFTEELLVYDLLWMDCWSLSFFALVVMTWLAPLRWSVRAPLLIVAFSAYGFVTGSLIFDGTPYSYNGFWGDQTFRQAMILKYMTFSWPTDFFYADLPPFYPPAYFLSLSLLGRLFSIEFIKLLKIGSLLIYLLGPVFLYIVWSRLVTAFQAALITIATFLFWSYGEAMPFYSPHAFLANIFFVPWWLFFIERVRSTPVTWRFVLWGGICGAVIFMTYPYAFFIGGFLMVLRSTLLLRWTYLSCSSTCRLLPAWLVLAAVALLSAPYWLPSLLSVVQYGGKPGDQEWFHIGHTGIKFEFLSFSLRGLLFLGSLYLMMRRSFSPLSRGLLTLVGASVLFHLIGTFMGSVGHPLNLQKATEFLIFVGGPIVGLAIATVVRYGRRRRQSKHALAIMVALILLVFLHNFNTFAKHGGVKSARTSPSIRTWGTVAEEMSERTGSVFLTAHGKFPAFFPVYMFIGNNQHYSHPASRFGQRYDFLYNLQDVHDPYIFALALRHNIFDAVDYFMPRLKDDHFEIPIGLSNYPIRTYHKALEYGRDVVSDTLLFVKETGDHLYRVRDPASYELGLPVSSPGFPSHDRLLYLMRLRMISEALTDNGRALLIEYVPNDWPAWQAHLLSNEAFQIAKPIGLVAAYSVVERDSLHLLFAFRVHKDLTKSYKLFLHLYGPPPGNRFYNFDFLPKTGTHQWKNGDIVLCRRSVPRPGEYRSFSLGLFDHDGRLGRTFNAHLPVE